MDFKYAHLADYAGDGGNGKLTLVGIFDTIFVGEQRPILLPSICLAAVFDAHVSEGSAHQFELRFCDQDGQDVISRARLPIHFVPGGRDRPLRGLAIVQFAPMPITQAGEYAFHLFIDGHEMTSLALHVSPRPGPVSG